ncbi:imidazole glycerol phosphate synthase subunit HisH [Paludifilum halophilum]|uniref:Imidazole glycerol phosphate synthase subunit HisH n=1 Tax=Paludifilum halophilum TaxID=1642702 RepID=A0A235B8F9_9BACL|nr:imidazole glycerol phosphate synthase subunit HisH [Paludifilum halophilum]OYD08147.1 imidazole glycerol phosphate synthase subunit HisH [Paludifilum halophilum]
MIAIIDYGMGNLYSVSQALTRMGYEWKITSDSEIIRSADGVILPGVGAFGDAMLELKKRGLIEVIKEIVHREGKPLLGICLGMQLLFTGSDEHGYHQGLNLIPGHVVRFEGDYNIPHMGWNELRFDRPHPLFQGVEEGYAYFVHSFHVIPDNPSDILAVTDYHQTVTAIVGRNQLFGMQFHPEKSGETGRKLLERFAALCTDRGNRR